MRFAAVLAAVIPFTAAAAVAPRSANTIVAAINNVQANIATVNTTLNQFKQGDLLGILTVLKVQSETEALRKAVVNATAITNASNILTTDGSDSVATVAAYLPDTLQSLADNLIRHKPAFDNVLIGIIGLASASPQVQKDLIAQQQSALALGVAIQSKLTGFYKNLAPVIISNINNTLNNAITTFNNTGGKLPIPPIFPAGKL